MHESDPLVRGLNRTLTRRLLMEPLVLLLAAAALAIAPALFGLALAGDLLRRRWALPWLRAAVFVVFYALAQAAGLVGLWAAWLGWRWRAPERYLAVNYAVGQRWARALYGAFEWLYGLEVVVDGEQHLTAGPLLVFPRHVSLADTLLPLILAPQAMRPRFVMKAALKLDPVLDVLGSRTPNAFVERGTQAHDAQIARVVALAEGAGPSDLIVLFPEGTRFTPERRDRHLARLAKQGDQGLERLALAHALEHTLPPHTGGPLGLMVALPKADVVFCAHTGFEGLTHLQDLLDGSMIGQHIRVKLWRVDAAAVPSEDGARRQWLFDEWRALDRWIHQARAPTPTCVNSPDLPGDLTQPPPDRPGQDTQAGSDARAK